MTVASEVDAPVGIAPADPGHHDPPESAVGDVVQRVASQGRRVLVSGSPRVAEGFVAAGAAAVGLVGGGVPPEGVTRLAGPVSRLDGGGDWEVVVLFGAGRLDDVFPDVSRALALAEAEVVVFVPRARRKWLGRSEEVFLGRWETDWLRFLLDLAGAAAVEEETLAEGILLRARA